MKFVTILIFLFLLMGFYVLSENDLALIEENSLEDFTEFYIKWLDEVYFNLQVITGKVVDLDWIPQNA